MHSFACSGTELTEASNRASCRQSEACSSKREVGRKCSEMGKTVYVAELVREFGRPDKKQAGAPPVEWWAYEGGTGHASFRYMAISCTLKRSSYPGVQIGNPSQNKAAPGFPVPGRG